MEPEAGVINFTGIRIEMILKVMGTGERREDRTHSSTSPGYTTFGR